MKISWIDLRTRIGYELIQLKEEGFDISALKEKWEKIQLDYGINEIPVETLNRVYDELTALTKNFKSRNEPSGWEEISAGFKTLENYSDNLAAGELEDKILGGWLGRSAGCLLGKPIEKIPRDGIRELLSSNNTWPIKDFITGAGIPEHLLKKYPWNRHSGKESLKENIECMAEDDDMNYAMLNLLVIEKYGREFTTENIAQTWLELLPALSTFTAERVTYFNLLSGIGVDRTAKIRNPYREWIGAQIRADFWGWVCAGNPVKAAEYAWRDARLSHTGNGIYGEMFFSAVIAISFIYNDVREILNDALLLIPEESRFSKAIKFVLGLNPENREWEDVVDDIYREYGVYHWVHTINNAALVTAALLSAKGDYETAICNVVMGGWDTDSNGATVGSVMGTMLGAKNLPEKWAKPLNNRIRSSMLGFDNSRLNELAKRTTNTVITK